MRLQLRLLGGFEGRLVHSEAVVLPTRKSKALLAYLALPAGRRHSREKLTALLWGDTAEPQARQNFRQALASIRRALAPGGADLVIADGDTLGLEAAAVDVDAMQFEQLAALTRPEALEGAAALYQGDLLEGLDVDETPFQEWLRAERERLRELALESLVRLLAAQMRTDGVDAAIKTALRVLALEPLQESVHRAVMRMLIRQGRRAAAMRQYQLCVAALHRELGAEPESETKELYREIVGASERAEARIGAGDPLLAARPKESPLIGRESEIAWLRQALEAAWNGEGHLALVVGEAGTGKTRLVEELVADAERLGGRALLGRGYEAEQVLPFRLWVDAIRAAGSIASTDGPIDRLPSVERAALTRLFPELGEPDRAGPTREEDLVRLFDAIVHLLREIAARQPLVVVLEDLHSADEMTLRLLAFAARRMRGPALLLLATVREEEMARVDGLAPFVQELAREGHVHRLELSPLSQGHTIALASAMALPRRRPGVSPDLATQVWALSEGNPFVIVETMRSLHADAELERRATVALPSPVRDMIRARLDRLGNESRHLAAVAAVIGRDFSFALLQRAAQLGVAAAAGGVEDLVRRRILDAVGEDFQFTHDRIRWVAHDAVPASERLALHAAVGTALEQLHAGRLDDVYEQLAHHFSLARDAERAFPYLVHLGDQAARRYAPDQAVEIWRQALDHVARLPAGARDHSQLEVVFRLAHNLYFMNRVPESLDLLLAERERVRRLEDPRRSGPYHFWLGYTLGMRGQVEQVALNARLAEEEAVRCGDTPTLGMARFLQGLERYWAGRPDEAVDCLRAAVRVLEATPERWWMGQSQWVLAICLYHMGEFDAAFEALDRLQAMARTFGESRLEACALWNRGLLHARRGHFEPAIESCRQGLALSRDPFDRAFSLGYLGAVHCEQENAAEAIPCLEESVRVFGESGAFRQHVAWFGGLLSEAYLLAGRVEEAARTADRAVDAGQASKYAVGLGVALRALGGVATVRGTLDESAAHLQRAVETFRSVLARFQQAQTQLVLARVAAARGDRNGAQSNIAEAHRLFVAMGVPNYAARARRMAIDLDVTLSS